ncbi:MAG TPA: PspC domain-containing protein [Rhodothermales bacterium]|nr:PspC domain-containing protein [Rhodothermales bacterium]
MATRTQKRYQDADEAVFQDRYTSLDLDSVSDDEIESMLFEEENQSSRGFLNLPTMAGLSLILVGVAYLFQELGFWGGMGDFLNALVTMLPWLAGILIILLGFGVLSWRPQPKRKKTKVKHDRGSSKPNHSEATYKGGKKRLMKSRNKKVAGVAGGIAEYFNIDPTVVRIAWIISIFVTNGVSLLVYLALAYIIPQPDALALEERITILRDS